MKVTCLAVIIITPAGAVPEECRKHTCNRRAGQGGRMSLRKEQGELASTPLIG